MITMPPIVNTLSVFALADQGFNDLQRSWPGYLGAILMLSIVAQGNKPQHSMVQILIFAPWTTSVALDRDAFQQQAHALPLRSLFKTNALARIPGLAKLLSGYQAAVLWLSDNVSHSALVRCVSVPGLFYYLVRTLCARFNPRRMSVSMVPAEEWVMALVFALFVGRDSATLDLGDMQLALKRSIAIMSDLVPEHVVNVLLQAPYDQCPLVSPRVMHTLNDLYSRLDTIIVDEMPSLYKVETIGDSYMCAANLLQRDPEHAATMIRFALRAQEEAAKVPTPTGDGTMLQMRCGIHSGPAMSGIVGKIRRRFCLFGSTVNMASRAESSCPEGAIQVTSTCLDLAMPHLPPYVIVTERGPVVVKGAAEPLHMSLITTVPLVAVRGPATNTGSALKLLPTVVSLVPEALLWHARASAAS
ncbi:hypothetical protein FOA52_005549 [Chlamydomonas sp. UWO 241]|nr:hypothetical protein FOA52_005549 [Chlamydomonas sp. UWO 241]